MYTEFVKSYFEEHTSCPGTVSLYGSQSRGFHPLPPRARRRATCTWGARGVDSAGAPPCTRVPFLCMPKEKVLRTRGLFGPSQTCATGTREPKERHPERLARAVLTGGPHVARQNRRARSQAAPPPNSRPAWLNPFGARARADASPCQTSRPIRRDGTLSPAQRAAPQPSKRRAHIALWGIESPPQRIRRVDPPQNLKSHIY
jgi:hypothetical protein